jgi:hypothetical protein
MESAVRVTDIVVAVSTIIGTIYTTPPTNRRLSFARADVKHVVLA